MFLQISATENSMYEALSRMIEEREKQEKQKKKEKIAKIASISGLIR